MAKSLFLTYLFWLFGGFLGLHHFYLGRDFHAFIWFMLPGGYFGLGWLRDFWRIPTYVKDANNDPKYLEKLSEDMRKEEKPSSGGSRIAGQLIVADVLGYLTLWALPYDFVPDWALPYCACLTPLAVATGVWIVGNIGRHEGGLLWPLIGAYVTYPLYFWSFSHVSWTAITSSTLFNWYGKRWRRTPKKKRSLLSRMALFTICACIYLAIVLSALYFSCEFKDKDGETIRCKDSVQNFFTSPMWKEFVKVMKDIYQYAKHHGWSEIWKQIVEALDPQGEKNALKTLNLTSGVSEDELRLVYRKLAKQWHPDRFKNPDEKQIAQEKFIEIQKAYECLSNIKNQRLKRNKSSRENPQPSPGTHTEF